MKNQNETIRSKIFTVIEGKRKHRKSSRIFDLFLIAFITLNVLTVVFESVAELHSAYAIEFYIFEAFSIFIFSIEYLIRIWVSVENEKTSHLSPLKARLKYAITPMALIDLVSILPFYFGFFFTIDLRFMRVIRLVRIFKLTRHSSAMTMLAKVFRQEFQVFSAALFVMFLLMIFSASMIYLFEHKAQPDAFSDIPKSMWWAVVTLTTVGYGDVYPVTGMGKLFGATISVIGIGMVALPAGILASGFSQIIHQNRSEYREHVQLALEDGILSPDETQKLRELQMKLGLSSKEAYGILRSTAHSVRTQFDKCPHCGEALQKDAIDISSHKNHTDTA